jgi:hypothetical protein
MTPRIQSHSHDRSGSASAVPHHPTSPHHTIASNYPSASHYTATQPHSTPAHHPSPEHTSHYSRPAAQGGVHGYSSYPPQPPHSSEQPVAHARQAVAPLPSLPASTLVEEHRSPRSPIISRLRRTLVGRHPLSKTWEKASFAEECRSAPANMVTMPSPAVSQGIAGGAGQGVREEVWAEGGGASDQGQGGGAGDEGSGRMREKKGRAGASGLDGALSYVPLLAYSPWLPRA